MCPQASLRKKCVGKVLHRVFRPLLQNLGFLLITGTVLGSIICTICSHGAKIAETRFAIFGVLMARGVQIVIFEAKLNTK